MRRSNPPTFARRERFALAAVLLVLFATTATALADEPAAEQENRGVFAKAIDAAQQRCVKIYGAGIGRVEGYATGVIISAEGDILTSQGVFLNGSRVRVVTPDGKTHDAQVMRRSPELQVAVLKIPINTPHYFEVLPKTPADEGEWVLSVTNLFKVADGPERLSVNLGIISLRTRLEAKHGTQDAPYEGDVLLVDAITSNPGAEGGALVNVRGELVGLVGKNLESKATNTRINYAIPSDVLARYLAGKPLQGDTPTGPIAKGETGIRIFDLVGSKRAPAYIERVMPGSPAEQAGLKKDDLILTVDGEIVRDLGDWRKLSKELVADKEVVLLVKRKDEILRATLTPKAVKDDAQ